MQASGVTAGTIAWSVREANALAAVAPPAPSVDGGTDDGTCAVCRGWAGAGYRRCFGCAMTMAQVSAPCDRVAVMSLYRPGCALHDLLRDYKDGPTRTRAVLSPRVGALFSSFLWREGPGLVPDGWDAVVTVPSTTGRPGAHPLEQALARVNWLAPQLAVGGLSAPARPGCGHRRADEKGWRVGKELRGSRVLLVDDTWASGARAQSAASALTASGVVVGAIAVMGRFMTPVAGSGSEEWWRRQVGAGPAGGLEGPARSPIRRRGTARRS
jgi:hypothetical protein